MAAVVARGCKVAAKSLDPFPFAVSTDEELGEVEVMSSCVWPNWPKYGIASD